MNTPLSTPLVRHVQFDPAYDRRDPDPNRNYGIHGMQIRFLLKGPRGAVQWLCYTDWQLPHVQRERRARHASFDRDVIHPEGYDLGYHSPEPRYSEHKPMPGKCPVIEGTCYYDGSSLNAQPLVEPFLREGDASVWRELERYYTATFGEKAP